MRMTSIVQLLLLATLNAAFANDFPFSAILASDPATQKPIYTVDWSYNRMNKTITFRLTVNSTGWLGFGLSPTGGMKDSDIVVGWVTKNGEAIIYDCFADGEHIPTVDARQDWELVMGYERNGLTNLIVTRKWITCDDNDVDIGDDTVRLIHSWSDRDPANVHSLSYHGTRRGSLSTNLLGNLVDPPLQPTDTKSFSISLINVSVPHDKSTTYWCLSALLPDYIQRTKVYITKFAPLLTRHTLRYAHHAELYLCKLTNRTKQLGFNDECYLNPGACSSRTLIAAWAIGGSDYYYPDGIGYPIGGSTDEFVWLEVHYDNPQMQSGVIDSTGFEFFYTEAPPKYEAGILAIGHMITPLMVIPPHTNSYSIYGLCGSSCMRNFIPDGGIHIISNGFHTHLAGSGLELSHLTPNSDCDGGYEELAPISKNLRYDFRYQQPSFLPKQITVLPNDLLVLRCTYNTIDRTNITMGGDSTHDEMCFAFVTYYPRMNLTTCASLNYLEPSSIDKELTHEDIQMLSNDSLFEGQEARNGVMNIFKKVHWNKEKVSDFQSANLNGYPRVFCESTSHDITVTQEMQLPKAGCPYLQTDRLCPTTDYVSSVMLLGATNTLLIVLLLAHIMPLH